jgi:YHS domain-containing protein
MMERRHEYGMLRTTGISLPPLRLALLLLGAASLMLPLSGCGDPPAARASGSPAPHSAPAGEGSVYEAQAGHGHVAPHGGALQVLANNRYHVEAVREPSGRIRVFLFGASETEMYPITLGTLDAEVRAGTEEARPLTLTAKPQAGEIGESSRFVGTLPPDLQTKPVALTITLPVAEKIHVVRFSAEELAPKSEAAGGGHDAPSEMPTPLASSGGLTPEEKTLFLQPGGAYTVSDIAANGSAVPRIKFAGIMASHDMNPKPGDRLCPITRTRANRKFAWVIGGKTYQFCCPPCVEEFVKKAKEDSSALPAPETFVKK